MGKQGATVWNAARKLPGFSERHNLSEIVRNAQSVPKMTNLEIPAGTSTVVGKPCAFRELSFLADKENPSRVFVPRKASALLGCPRSQPISPDLRNAAGVSYGFGNRCDDFPNDLDVPDGLDPEEIDMPCH